VDGRAVDAIAFDFVNNTSGHDIAVTYADHPGVIYRDLLAGKYRADHVPGLASGARSLLAQDVDYDGTLDLLAAGPGGPLLLLNHDTKLDPAPVTGPRSRVVALADFENRAVADLVANGAVLRNQARGKFAAPAATVLGDAVALAIADFDSDGRIDAAAIAADGSLHLLHNDTKTA
jgi:hypothetical protein